MDERESTGKQSRLWQRGRRLVGKVAGVVSSTRQVTLSLEGMQWAEIGTTGVRWRDRSAPADQFAPAELSVPAGARVTYRLNLPAIGGEFRARCQAEDGGAAGRFAVTIRPLEGDRAELRREARAGAALAVGLGPLAGRRVEFTLESAAAGAWLDPHLWYATPRASFARRLRAYLAASGTRGLAANVARRLGGGKGRAPVAGGSVALLLPLDGGGSAEALRRTVESVVAQSSPCWELWLIAAPGSGLHPTSEELAAADARVHVLDAGEDSGRAGVLRAGLAAAGGEIVTTLRAGDALARGAVELVLARFAAEPPAPWLYTDEEACDEHGSRTALRAKPAWGLDSLFSGLLPGRGCFYRRGRVMDAGGFLEDHAGADEYDLALRLAAQGQFPVHLPVALYRAATSAAGAAADTEAHRAAADAHLARTGAGARAVSGLDPTYFRTRYDIQGSPLVSIILPTNGVRREINGRQIDLLATCVRSIVERSDYPHFEVLCVDNANLQPETLAALDTLNDGRVRVISFRAPFNLADKFNWAVGHARGEHLLLLNDDTEIIAPEWLRAMLEFSQQERVGAVGAKLFFPSGQLQHAGVPLHHGLPGHWGYGLPADLDAGTPELRCVRNFSAVTGACLMTRRALYEQLGGFHRDFPINYNDVAYCLAARAAGHDVVFTPFATLWHYESLSREKGATLAEVERMRSRWADRVQDDPDQRPSLWVSGSAFNWLPD